MKKRGIAKIGRIIGNISAGKFTDYDYVRQEPAQWDLPPSSTWIFDLWQ